MTYDAAQIATALSSLSADIHNTAREKGWWETKREFPEVVALIHSELSEALEGWRTNKLKDDHCPEFTSVEIELADAIIRILDYAKAESLTLIPALIAKHEYNKTRPYRHGGKRA